jgi:S1-C subfamily serine protease
VAQVIHELRIGIPFSNKDELQPSVDATTKKLFEDTSPAIVNISADNATGTGFFMDNAGRIATDAHVVLDSSHLTVTTSSGKKASARIIALDDIDDLAIIQIDGGTPEDIKPLALGKSDEKPDDKLWGIGHAEGSDNLYISPGYFRRSETISDVMQRESDKDNLAAKNKIALMTPLEKQDAKAYVTRPVFWGNVNIRSGDSGGPCIDRNEKVVGLNDLSNGESDSTFTPVEKLKALSSEKNPKFQFSYKKTEAGWALTDITRTDGTVRPPYEDSLASTDSHSRPDTDPAS